jgi:transposase
LDIHRAQITFDYADLRSGEEVRGVIRPATREAVRAFVAGLGRKKGAFAMEATTGWRLVTEELEAGGFEAHVAEPADTRALAGPKRRAKTDRADARLLRDLLLAGRLPESWIPPDNIAQLRTTVRLRKSLMDERTAWMRRMQAQLFHHGLPIAPELATKAGRQALEQAPLPPASRQVVDMSCRMVDRIDAEIDGLDRQLAVTARRLGGCVVLQKQWGIGPILATTILAELGDTHRFASSRQPCASPAGTSPSQSPTANAAAVTCPIRARRCCAGRFMRPPAGPGGSPRPTTSTTSTPKPDWVSNGPVFH